MTKTAAKSEEVQPEAVAAPEPVNEWDALLANAVEEKREESRVKPKKVDIPATLVELVERLYKEKKRQRLPIDSDDKFYELRDALFSACEESALNIQVRCMDVTDDDTKQRFIQYTVSAKRGRPAKKTDEKSDETSDEKSE